MRTWIREKADDLWSRLMARLDNILVALMILFILGGLMLGFWTLASMKHERCVEALKSQTVNPAVIMAMCRD